MTSRVFVVVAHKLFLVVIICVLFFFLTKHRLILLIIRHSFLFLAFTFFLTAVTGSVILNTVLTDAVTATTFCGYCVGLDHFKAILFEIWLWIVFFNVPAIFCFWPAIVIDDLSFITHIVWIAITSTVAGIAAAYIRLRSRRIIIFGFFAFHFVIQLIIATCFIVTTIVISRQGPLLFKYLT